MLDEVELALEGRRYLWTHDPNVDRAEVAWSWADAQSFMTPSTRIAALLNRQFVETKALDVASSLTSSDLPYRLYDILRSMGAADADFDRGALKELLAYRKCGPRTQQSGNWPNMSPLRALGYKVGENRIPASERHAILSAAYKGKIPFVGSEEYMAQWGSPGSAARLKKIANYLAANCQNMKRKGNESSSAITDWESDLRWLRETYYDCIEWPADNARFIQDHFLWPSTEI